MRDSILLRSVGGCLYPVLAVTLAAFITGCASADNQSGRLSAEKIKAIELGMTTADVKRRLGEPVRVRREPELMLVALQFSADPFFTRTYPMLWVNTRDDRVVEVYAKRYDWWGLDEAGIYRLYRDGMSEAPAFTQLFQSSR